MLDRLRKLVWWLDHEGYHVPEELRAALDSPLLTTLDNEKEKTMKIDTDKLISGLEECIVSIRRGCVSSGFTMGDVEGKRVAVTAYSADEAEDEGVSNPHHQWECLSD